jgi:malate dehydrogenase (oxaloacetate-decarboxylating)(NADP+)
VFFFFKQKLQALANRVSEQDLAEGRLYPPLGTIRDCSTAIAAYIAEHAYKNGIIKLSSIYFQQ